MASKKKQPNKIGAPPTELEFEKALMFFHAYMYGPLQGKLRLYSARSVRSPGASSDWEVFASILVSCQNNSIAIESMSPLHFRILVTWARPNFARYFRRKLLGIAHFAQDFILHRVILIPKLGRHEVLNV
jgi:hypothetical protein